MTLGDPFLPDEPEWLIREKVGLPPIKKTSELPKIIPSLPQGDTRDLKVWQEYWSQHDISVRNEILDKLLNRLDIRCNYVHDIKLSSNEFAEMIKELREVKGGERE